MRPAYYLGFPLLCACSGGLPSATNLPTLADTDTDTDVGQPPDGVPTDATLTGSRYFAAGGTTVGSFDFCETGSGTLWIAETAISGELVCPWEREDCTMSFRDQPLEGPWAFQWSCDNTNDGHGVIEPDSLPPEPIVASVSFDIANQAGGTTSTNLDLTTE